MISINCQHLTEGTCARGLHDGRPTGEQCLMCREFVGRLVVSHGKPKPAKPAPCASLGEPTGEFVDCPTCKGSVKLRLFHCAIFGWCTAAKSVGKIACCAGCREYQAKELLQQ